MIVGVVALTLPLVVRSATAFGAANKAAGVAGKSKDDKADEDKGSEKSLPPILQQALEEKEAQVTEARREAIKLLEDYLRENPSGSAGFRAKEQAEALYKLAELYWEESKEVYLEKMGRYQAAVSACHSDRSACPKVPHRPPTIDLSQAQAVYRQLIDKYPKFRKIDTVIYLYAFSLRDQQKVGESINYFQIILDKYPRSRYIADAWMAIAEYRFYEKQDYRSSLEAYEKVLKHPKSTLYDLALFKTAWCYWKLGDTTKSAQRFKDVLDLAKKKAGRSEAQQRRAEELQGEALDYLV
ncbi:MAG TPA: tetratricopeptide repeat protein, partial [Polyangia bacterium]